ncbi:MAG: putative mu-like prophage Flumu protein gp28 [Verrucomicrobiales bacterium]|nr:putative mu-like prophage Flumu protein gp28 [Verrucomicrobiales bacterium]
MSARTPLVLPIEPQDGWRIARGARPEHARNFPGAARNIPEAPQFWLWYQHRWIHDRSLMRLFPKSRRIGISYATAYDYVRSRSLAGCRADAWVSSRDEVSALEFQRYCSAFARALNTGARDLGLRVLEESKTGAAKSTAHVLGFANGKRIYALSGNPDAMASKGGDVGLDEFALRKDPQQAFSIAKPTIAWGGRLALISSMRPGYFAQLCNEVEEKKNPKGWSYHKITLQDALDQGYLWKLQSHLPPDDERLGWDEGQYFDNERASAASAEAFAQEYMCVPADESAAFITYAMISSCQYPGNDEWEWTLEEAQQAKQNGAQLYGGLDIGRKKDFTWFTLTEKVGDVHFVRKIITLRGQTFQNQERELYPWFRVCRRLCGDSTGLGAQFMEDARRQIGKYQVEEITFTQPVKEDLAYPVRTAFEDKDIRIPEDALLTAHLRAIRRETTKAGNIRFTADSSEDGHADGFWSLALCLHAAGGQPPPVMPATFAAATGGGLYASARRTRSL